MKKSRFTEEQIAFALRQAETGVSPAEICRKMGISEQTYYRWRTKYGGMDPQMARQLKDLAEAERPAQEAGGGPGPRGLGYADSVGGGPPKLVDPDRLTTIGANL